MDFNMKVFLNIFIIAIITLAEAKRSQTSRGKEREVNRCHAGSCHVNAKCINIKRRYKCKCHAGYIGNGVNCVDEDECSYQNGHCVQTCSNTIGSFKCGCCPGFTLADDGFNCIDNNECLTQNGGCDHTCTNTVGGRLCRCRRGFYSLSDGTSCRRVREIQQILCHRCEQICTASAGASRSDCACSPGYTLQADKRHCKAASCAVGNGGCQHRCTQKKDGVLCTCSPGYQLVPSPRQDGSCTPLCSLNNGNCEHVCEDTEEGPKCRCPAGYNLATDGKACIDINECLTSNGNCSHTCVNTLGGYDCTCPEGYQTNDWTKTCQDINECRYNTTCDHICLNTAGSYRCQCKVGYAVYGVSHCGDVDECSAANGGCRYRCTNTIGSYRCTCPRGQRPHENGYDCVGDKTCGPVPLTSQHMRVSCREQGALTSCNITCVAGHKLLSGTAKVAGGIVYQCGQSTGMQWKVHDGGPALPYCSGAVTAASTTRTVQFAVGSLRTCDLSESNARQFYGVVNKTIREHRFCSYGRATCGVGRVKLACQTHRKRYRDELQKRRDVIRTILTVRFNFTVTASSNGKCNKKSCGPKTVVRVIKKSMRALRKAERLGKLLTDTTSHGYRRLLKNSVKVRNDRLHCGSGRILVADICVGCAAGTYHNGAACKMCPKGTYQDEEGKITCKPCKGNTGTIEGATNEKHCAGMCIPGTISASGSEPCFLCQLGTYQPSPGRSSCIGCPNATLNSRAGSVAFSDCLIDPCKAGYYHDPHMKGCRPCPTDSYQPQSGMNFCIKCPASTLTDSTGSMSLSECKDRRCGGVFNGTTQGSLVSPNWPGPYPANADCVWEIIPEKNRKIMIVIPALSLGEGQSQLCTDVLIMRKSESPYSTQTYETCSSVNKPLAFTARSKSLWINFKSDGSKSGNGFNIPFVTFHSQYTALIDEIVKDGDLYTSPKNQQMLKDRNVLWKLLEVTANPVKYEQYAKQKNDVLPSSFIYIIAKKLRRFYSTMP